MCQRTLEDLRCTLFDFFTKYIARPSFALALDLFEKATRLVIYSPPPLASLLGRRRCDDGHYKKYDLLNSYVALADAWNRLGKAIDRQRGRGKGSKGKGEGRVDGTFLHSSSSIINDNNGH